MRSNEIPVLNVELPRPRRRLPRPGRAEVVVAVVAIVVWAAVGYGVAMAAGLVTSPLGP